MGTQEREALIPGVCVGWGSRWYLGMILTYGNWARENPGRKAWNPGDEGAVPGQVGHVGEGEEGAQGQAGVHVACTLQDLDSTPENHRL